MALQPAQPASFRPGPILAWSPLIVGLAAAAFLMVISFSGLAIVGALTVAALGLGLSIRLRQQRAVMTPPLAVEAPPPPPPAAAPPFAAVFEAFDDPVMVILGEGPEDLSGRRLIHANAAARELFPTTREDVRLTTAVRDPKVLEGVDEALFGAIASETVYEAGGVQGRVWRARARPLGSQGEGRPLALLTLRDETELRRSERTRADFLANASHELRTPLASLSGFIETLRGHAREDPEARDRFLAIMQDQAQRMARLIDDLMSLSRIELNEHIPPQGRVDLSLTVKDVLDALSPLAAGKQLRFHAEAPDEPARIQPADRDQVLQVIQNLTENACKYAPAGSTVSLEVIAGVSAEAAMAPRCPGSAHMALLTPDHAADQTYVALRIGDEGPGMAREHLPRLTERFYRVEGQKTGERAGTGLGLAIVKHIMNRHRGGMTVESALDQGSTFTVYFPAMG